MKRSAPSRIINLTSLMHFFGKINFEDIMFIKRYNATKSYSQSKLAIVMFSRSLNRQVEGSGVKVVSVHPGVVRTDMTRHLEERWYIRLGMFVAHPVLCYVFKNVWQGVQTMLYCALCEELRGGEYYADCRVREMSVEGRDEEVGRKLWEVSERLVGERFVV